MAFPTSPTNGQSTTVNGITYTYASATNSWTRSTNTLGNIVSINLDGNSSTILYGNGIFASAPVSYNNSNVSTFLASYGSNTIVTTGNITAGNIIGIHANGNSNVNIPAANGNVNISAVGNANVVVVTGVGANITGTANVTGNIIGGSKLLVGTGSSGLTNPVGVFQGSGATYTQVAMFNSTGTGSADIVTYGNNGDDTQSWADMGFTGNTFNDANYTVTGPGDGYFFTLGNASFGGNMVIATGAIGTTKDIIFATGGFLTANIKARLYNANGVLSVTSGFATTGTVNYTAASNVSLGSNANIKITGGTTGQFLSTDGAGNLSWSTASGSGGGATITNDVATNANTFYPVFTTLTSGSMSTANVATTKLYYNPGTGTLNSTIFNSLSDETVKSGIKRIANALDKLKTLHGYTYYLIDGNEPSAGLISQQVQKVLPEATKFNAETGLLSLNYNGVIGMIVEAVNELEERVTRIENNALF